MVYLDSVILTTAVIEIEDVEEIAEEDVKEDAEEDVVEETIGVMIGVILIMKAMTYFLYYFFSP
ncbi:MAG TPA: hypothetical protein DCL31_02435, partial [Clostridium sp.]|nr:hypothetical protein [Clostridium sp.]